MPVRRISRPPDLAIAGHARLGDVFPMLLSAACRDFAAELSTAGKGGRRGCSSSACRDPKNAHALRPLRTRPRTRRDGAVQRRLARFRPSAGQRARLGRVPDRNAGRSRSGSRGRSAPTRPRGRGGAGSRCPCGCRDRRRRSLADRSAARPVALDGRRHLARRRPGASRGSSRSALPQDPPRPARQARRQGGQAPAAI